MVLQPRTKVVGKVASLLTNKIFPSEAAVDLLFNKPLYNKDLGVTNDVLQPSEFKTQ